MSCDMYQSVFSGSLVVDSCTESDHVPVVLTFARKESTAEHCNGHSEPGHVRYTEKNHLEL